MEKKSHKILVVDDDRMVQRAISGILKSLGYSVEAVSSGARAVEIVDNSFDVILLDINMRQMDGFATIEALNKLNLEIPVVFLTGAGSMDYAVRAINLGAYDFLNKPITDLDLFHVKITRAIEKRTYVLNEINYKENLEKEIQLKTRQLEEQNKLLFKYSNNLEAAALQIMLSLQNAMEEKDYYTAGHSVRVTDYSVMIGTAMEVSRQDLLVLRRSAQFHDIGKLVIDLSCIQKPGKLSKEEWRLIEKHPIVGANIIEPLTFLKRERVIICQHHERIDGNGYPYRLKGDQLDPFTKILTVADSFDTMTSGRNYRKISSTAEAVTELYRCAGSQFDKNIVEVLADNIVEFIAKNSRDKSIN